MHAYSLHVGDKVERKKLENWVRVFNYYISMQTEVIIMVCRDFKDNLINVVRTGDNLMY